MASNNSKSKVFDSEEASTMVKELRKTFDCGKTRGYEWRSSQLKALIKLSEKHEKEIVQALYSDLSKSEIEAYVQEVLFLSLSTL
ncbi:hypothetical protein VNO78_30879 [Psophocarpus tetragonolobus]|uniref:Aldehyde dehydrogenase n=1 Tax=Psophocarpus tetragonolobus TaxID=3891 RepID=A0AAN9X6G5_PSOTE